ncbi:helix-turn-helix domain-containing protein [Schleiferilactobacillus shenzhenensis]|nr:helix-turn-helix domain-containing protein [Schleiferilactobacillus shenzhenensis]
MQFSDKLKTARQQRQLTQAPVAEQIHVSPKTISSWENGRSFPDLGTLVRISDYYGISLDQLLREDERIMDHYETIDKQVQRDRRIFQITYFANVILLILAVIDQAAWAQGGSLRGWLTPLLVINLGILASHYPAYREWFNTWAHRLLLIILFLGISTPFIVKYLHDGLSTASMASNHAAYDIGYMLGGIIRTFGLTLSVIYAVFGFAELKETH